MKKLFITLAIILLAVNANAWTLTWDDTIGEDGYIIKYKDYPAGFSFPDNPASEADIQDMTGATEVVLPAETIEWDIPAAEFTENNRYVFVIQATLSGSVSGFSDYLCWTWPVPGQVIEQDVQAGGGIQINIYQKP